MHIGMLIRIRTQHTDPHPSHCLLQCINFKELRAQQHLVSLPLRSGILDANQKPASSSYSSCSQWGVADEHKGSQHRLLSFPLDSGLHSEESSQRMLTRSQHPPAHSGMLDRIAPSMWKPLRSILWMLLLHRNNISFSAC